MTNLEKLKLEALINQLSQSARELIQLGDSHEKSKGSGILDAVTQISNLIGCSEKTTNYNMFRQIRFFLFYYKLGKLPNLNIYMRLYNIIDGPGDGKKICFENLEKYFLDIYLYMNSKIKYDEFDIVAEDIVNILNKK